MSKYTEFKNKQQSEYDAFPRFYAFNQKQFDEGMASFGYTPDDKDKIINIGHGGFIRKSDKSKYIALLNKLSDEHHEMLKDEQYVYEMFMYELGNHEYCITYDLNDTINACGLTMYEVNKNPILKDMLNKARKDYLKSCR